MVRPCVARGFRRAGAQLRPNVYPDALYVCFWHKADMPHTATNVCFWQKSGRVYNLRVLERTDTRHAVGSNPVSAQFLWKTGTMPKMSRDFWHNSPKNFQIRDAENQCLR